MALSAGCATALCACLYALWHGAAPRESLAGVVPAHAIGRVSIAAADIRRRSDRSLAWETLHNGDSAYAQDTLFVPPGADAQLIFNDGTTLELAENSLVVVETSESPRVHLAQGTLLAQKVPRALAIDTVAGVTELAPRASASVSARGEDARIDVFNGTAHANGQALAAGDARVLAAGVSTTAPAWPAQLLSPDRNQRLFVPATPPALTLLWKSPLHARLQIDTSEEFTHPTLEEQAPASNSYTFHAPTPGIYYWRLADDAGHSLSETRRFTLAEDKPPEPLRPAVHEIVGALPSHLLAFVWTPAAGAEHYRLELSTRPDFATLIVETASQSTVAYLERELGEGTYYWRVRVDPAERPGAPYSRTLAFRLVTKPVLEAPKLLGAEVQVGH